MKTKEIFTMCFCLLVITGISLNLDFYQSTVHPLNMTEEHLKGILGSSDISQIQAHLAEVRQNLNILMEKLPESKNPVWLYPTESTNFLRIENDLDRMTISFDKLSGLPKDTSAYHTGMLDMHSRVSLIKENLLDARGFLYGSATNVFFTLIWIIGAIGLTRMWIRK